MSNCQDHASYGDHISYIPKGLDTQRVIYLDPLPKCLQLCEFVFVVNRFTSLQNKFDIFIHEP